MATPTAFQTNAHQTNAFQIDIGGVVTPLAIDLSVALSVVFSRQINLSAAASATFTVAQATLRSYLRAIDIVVTFGVTPTLVRSYLRAVAITVTVTAGVTRSFTRLVDVVVTTTVGISRGFTKLVGVAIDFVLDWLSLLIRVYSIETDVPVSMTVSVTYAINYGGTPPGQWNRETRRRNPPVTIDKVQD